MTGLHALRLALVAAALAVVPARAQDLPPLVIEPRGGASLPVADFRADAERAPSFGLHFVYRSPAGWGPYGGFSQHRFGCAAGGCAAGDYVATSWDFGAQRTIDRFGWVRAGMLFARLERGAAQTSLSMGAEAGAGFLIPMRGRMSLTPGVRYGWLNTRFGEGDLVRMRWLSADVGLAIGF